MKEADWMDTGLILGQSPNVIVGQVLASVVIAIYPIGGLLVTGLLLARVRPAVLSRSDPTITPSIYETKLSNAIRFLYAECMRYASPRASPHRRRRNWRDRVPRSCCRVSSRALEPHAARRAASDPIACHRAVLLTLLTRSRAFAFCVQMRMPPTGGSAQR